MKKFKLLTWFVSLILLLKAHGANIAVTCLLRIGSDGIIHCIAESLSHNAKRAENRSIRILTANQLQKLRIALRE